MTNPFKAINYQYPQPKNFKKNDPEFDIFQERVVENCAASEIRLLKNVRIANNSVVFRYFKVFAETCINLENYKKYQKGFKFFLKFFFPKLNFSKKRFLLITDEYTSNYYHWHNFALKRLLAFKEEGLLRNSLLLLPKKYQSYPFVFPSLKKFGVIKNQIIFLPRKSNIKVKELAIVDSSRQHPKMFQNIRKLLTENHEICESEFGDKIYISRENQVLRFVENEQEVVKLLEKYGFKKIIMEKISYEQQIAICAKARYLIAPHGAGITNIFFMPENSSLLEMTTLQTLKTFNHYYALASMLNINYFYQKCEIGERSKVKDFHHGSLVVDLKKLEQNLQLMLKE
jgi:capsular polysaccharide biosynthesis protein